jgi:succinate dehydrogenase/fumarate reductase cytochrome b subunit
MGPVLGWSAVALGAAGVVGAILAAANGPSVLVAVSILGALVFHLAVGVRCIRLSRG